MPGIYRWVVMLMVMTRLVCVANGCLEIYRTVAKRRVFREASMFVVMEFGCCQR
jgi:hypothetical protein